MRFTTINVENSTKERIKKIASKNKISIKDLIERISIFITKNEEIFNADFFQKSEYDLTEDIKSKLELPIKKAIRKEINRMIGFIKVQDKYMRVMKKDILWKLQNGEEIEYNPLFQEYEYMLDIHKEIFEMTDEEIHKKIKEKLGSQILQYYIESENKVKAKRILID